MKLHHHRHRTRALMMEEVLIVIFILALLGLVFFIGTARGGWRFVGRQESDRIGCVNNLKQVGLAYRIWEGDNNDRYPIAVSVTNGGAMELVATGNVVAVFQCMSNELSTPKILACPADADHFAATNFLVDFSARNLSYFAGLDADDSQPQAVLSGDANLIVNGRPTPAGMVNLATSPAAWTKGRHGATGNVGFADGSVQSSIHQMGFVSAPGTIFSTNRVVIP